MSAAGGAPPLWSPPAKLDTEAEPWLQSSFLHVCRQECARFGPNVCCCCFGFVFFKRHNSDAIAWWKSGKRAQPSANSPNPSAVLHYLKHTHNISDTTVNLQGRSCIAQNPFGVLSPDDHKILSALAKTCCISRVSNKTMGPLPSLGRLTLFMIIKGKGEPIPSQRKKTEVKNSQTYW